MRIRPLLRRHRRASAAGPRRGGRPGFTLLELLITVPVAVMILVTVTSAMLTVVAGRKRTAAHADVQQSLRSVLERIQTSVRNATSLTAADNGILALGGSAAVGGEPAGPAALYSLSGATVYLTEGGGTPVALTPDTISVSQLAFTNLGASTGPPIVRVRITAADVVLPGARDTLAVSTAFSLRQ